MTLIIPADINLPVRDSACTCCDDQLRHVGCDCEAGDPLARVACWPTGRAQGRPETFVTRGSYAELEARRRHGRDARVFSVTRLPTQPETFSAAYIREMSQGG